MPLLRLAVGLLGSIASQESTTSLGVNLKEKLSFPPSPLTKLFTSLFPFKYVQLQVVFFPNYPCKTHLQDDSFGIVWHLNSTSQFLFICSVYIIRLDEHLYGVFSEAISSSLAFLTTFRYNP